jgi:hypothetical protein
VTVVAPAGTVLVADADTGAAADSLEVVRRIDANELSEQASRGGLARLNSNQRILVAVVLITAVFATLSPETHEAVLDDALFAAAIAAVLSLLKR